MPLSEPHSMGSNMTADLEVAVSMSGSEKPQQAEQQASLYDTRTTKQQYLTLAVIAFAAILLPFSGESLTIWPGQRFRDQLSRQVLVEPVQQHCQHSQHVTRPC
jgi:hypothetical protein